MVRTRHAIDSKEINQFVEALITTVEIKLKLSIFGRVISRLVATFVMDGKYDFVI